MDFLADMGMRIKGQRSAELIITGPRAAMLEGGLRSGSAAVRNTRVVIPIRSSRRSTEADMKRTINVQFSPDEGAGDFKSAK